MTVRDIHEAVGKFKKVSRPQIYYYFAALNIKPIGAQQRPARYPEKSALIILHHLGFAESEELAPAPSTSAGNGVGHRQAARLPTMPELRATRKKARGK